MHWPSNAQETPHYSCTALTPSFTREQDRRYLLVFGNSPQEDQHPIPTPAGFIPSLVHACVLLIPSAEGVVDKALPGHDWLALIPPGQADAADVQLTLLTYTSPKCFL